MSCLSKSHRINSKSVGGKRFLTKEFNHIYKSKKRWHTNSFVIFFQDSEDFRFAFVASKKVGNAVKRNRARRLLKALVLNNEQRLKNGKYIFVAKSTLIEKDYKSLQKDFNFAAKRLNLYKVPFV